MQHKDMAMKLMQKFAEELKELALMDREPKMEGKSVLMILSPLPQRGTGKPTTDPNEIPSA
jgi:translation initiation factor IF-3